MENLSCVQMTASSLAARTRADERGARTHTHAQMHMRARTVHHTLSHIPLRPAAPTKPQRILGTIMETRDHRSGQRTQTEGERGRAREIERDDKRERERKKEGGGGGGWGHETEAEILSTAAKMRLRRAHFASPGFHGVETLEV